MDLWRFEENVGKENFFQNWVFSEKMRYKNRQFSTQKLICRPNPAEAEISAKSFSKASTMSGIIYFLRRFAPFWSIFDFRVSDSSFTGLLLLIKLPKFKNQLFWAKLNLKSFKMV